MSDPKALVQDYFDCIEQGDEARLLMMLHPGVIQQELPNRLNPNGVEYDLAGMIEAFRRGTKVLFSQKYEIKSMVAQGDTLALEVAWSGTLAVAVGSRAPGDVLRASFAVFLEFRDGQIFRQRNYDCFEPF
ncbi:nuclear transport factor 2 family protein [Pendulispora brunnea]|uniref:Nuclear transport factor 2 family protein n=1 Tax=Pendulispora brunnea TaxID=2905690 RepID=A0ABZ2K2P3_9BACT